jgi:hypothetical protein
MIKTSVCLAILALASAPIPAQDAKPDPIDRWSSGDRWCSGGPAEESGNARSGDVLITPARTIGTRGHCLEAIRHT